MLSTSVRYMMYFSTSISPPPSSEDRAQVMRTLPSASASAQAFSTVTEEVGCGWSPQAPPGRSMLRGLIWVDIVTVRNRNGVVVDERVLSAYFMSGYGVSVVTWMSTFLTRSPTRRSSTPLALRSSPASITALSLASSSVTAVRAASSPGSSTPL